MHQLYNLPVVLLGNTVVLLGNNLPGAGLRVAVLRGAASTCTGTFSSRIILSTLLWKPG